MFWVTEVFFIFNWLQIVTSLIQCSQLHELNPSVFGTSFVGSVVSYGRGLSFAGSGEAVSSDTQFDQFVNDSFAAGFTQCLVGNLVTGAVGMAFDGEFEVGVFFHQGNDTIDFTHTLRFDGRFTDIEGDTVSDEFAIGHHAVVEWDGTFGDADITYIASCMMIIVMSVNRKPCMMNGVGYISNPCAVDIGFKSTFIK